MPECEMPSERNKDLSMIHVGFLSLFCKESNKNLLNELKNRIFARSKMGVFRKTCYKQPEE